MRCGHGSHPLRSRHGPRTLSAPLLAGHSIVREPTNLALEVFTRLLLSGGGMWAPRQSGDVASGSEPHYLGPAVVFFAAWASAMAVVVAVLLTGGDETVPNWLVAVAGTALVAASWWLLRAVRDDDL
jgi:hypothetical protein